jgi:MFS family permease
VEQRPPWILPVIILSQFAGTSLWFAGNAVIGDLQLEWGLSPASLSYITSSVQLGFIAGTLFFAFFLISDRFSPRLVFFICSMLGAAANLGVFLVSDGLTPLLIFRFITGFFLAGIYPVGMKIAAGWYKHGLGAAMGYLVGALVLGTAFPHLLKSLEHNYEWESVVISVSVISIIGGLLMLIFVPNGPYLSKGTKFNPRAIQTIFKSKSLRQAAFGYFGHMWELYTMWTFVPLLLAYYAKDRIDAMNIPLWSFWIIAAGGVGCALGGIISKRTGSKPVAFYQLLASGICCLLSPLIFTAPLGIFLVFLLFWGVVIAGDSPQFSALVAISAPKEYVGSALTIVTSIGFLITVFSIQFINSLVGTIDVKYLMLFLLPGPVFGLISLLNGKYKLRSD